jgi:hypothetical protein
MKSDNEKKEEFDNALHKMDWIDRTKFQHCVGDGKSHYAMVADGSVMVTVCKYIDSVIDLKIKVVDFRKDKEVSFWMSEKEAQMLVEALNKFYGREEKK